jgi:hypothetical protein
LGNDSKLKVLSKGTYHGHTIIDDNGDKVIIKLLDVLYVPELTVILFSVTKGVSQPRAFFVGSDQVFQLKTDTQSFTFDKQIKHGSGNLYAAQFYPNHQHTKGEIVLAVTTMPFKEYHCLFGHANKFTVMDIVAHHNIGLNQNTEDPCPHFVRAKIRMKTSLNKSSIHPLERWNA